MKQPNKDLHISFRVSPEQKRFIEEKAELAYLSVSDFVRAAALGREVKVIADVLRPYGIRVFLSVNFASPMVIGNREKSRRRTWTKLWR